MTTEIHQRQTETHLWMVFLLIAILRMSSMRTHPIRVCFSLASLPEHKNTLILGAQLFTTSTTTRSPSLPNLHQLGCNHAMQHRTQWGGMRGTRTGNVHKRREWAFVPIPSKLVSFLIITIFNFIDTSHLKQKSTTTNRKANVDSIYYLYYYSHECWKLFTHVLTNPKDLTGLITTAHSISSTTWCNTQPHTDKDAVPLIFIVEIQGRGATHIYTVLGEARNNWSVPWLYSFYLPNHSHS